MDDLHIIYKIFNILKIYDLITSNQKPKLEMTLKDYEYHVPLVSYKRKESYNLLYGKYILKKIIFDILKE